MTVCPKCKKPVATEAEKCLACGQVLSTPVDGTLDLEQHFEFDSAKKDPKNQVDATPEPPSADEPTGGTLDVPQIPDERIDETNTQPEADVDVSGRDGTASEFVAVDPTDLDKTLDVASEATIDLDSSAAIDPGATIDSVDDLGNTADIPTIMFDGSQAEATGDATGTVDYSTQELEAAEQGNGKSGTAGKLKRMWGGAAGSSLNPMHTLKGAEPEASDSVFERVANRVLVTDTAIAIAEKAGSTKSQPQRKQRVEECIRDATRGSEGKDADYDLTGFLGQGGMGVVLKARQNAIGRDVAIKMIQPSKGSTAATTKQQKKKFFYEAQITGKLDHPNIVPVYDLGSSNDVIFYSMKKIDGKEWKEVIRDATRDENLDTFMKVADAMAFAHQREIIHRDLKPENVMIGQFGEVLVTDWGCAVDLTLKEKLTGAGSPPWMAPEMASQQNHRIGTASDVYLLGAILYEIIAGHPPHPGRTIMEVLQAAARNEIRKVETEDPLLDIAMKAMETDPKDRFATVEEMQAAIRDYRRHAESILLSERAEATLEKAIETKDYERFSRSLFGFQDAVDLWEGNSAAKRGLADARLAYGQCAFDRADYDLCLGTLDESVPEEKLLAGKARKAKTADESRKGLIKYLAAAVAAAVLIGFGVSSVLAVMANRSAKKALVAQGIAEKQTEIANIETERAKIAAAAEKKSKIDAEVSAADALAAKIIAEDKTKIAEEATKDKEAALIRQTELAKSESMARIAEEGAKKEALLAQEKAEERAAAVELGTYRANLALALNQVEKANIRAAVTELKALTNADSYEALNLQMRQPDFDNWAVNRVELLSNNDLLANPLGKAVSAAGFASEANVGAIATVDANAGVIHVVEVVGNRLSKTGLELKTGSPVGSLSIAPDGSEVIYTLTSPAGDSTVNSWTLREDSQPIALVQNQNKRYVDMQGLTISGDRVVGGINGGLWVWSRNNANWQSQEPTRIKNIRGRLRSLQMMDEVNALVLAEFNDGLVLYRIDLNSNSADVSPVTIPMETDDESAFRVQDLSALCFSNNNLIVGTKDGRLFSTAMSMTASSVGPNFRELTPQKHAAAITSIEAHRDGTLVSMAAEPVIYVWSPSKSEAAGWKLETGLTGTTENVAVADFMTNSNLILGLGADSRPIIWDIARQKQRQQVVPETSGTKTDVSPVIEVVTSTQENRAISIRANGSLDVWDTATGKAFSARSPSSFSSIGHTPGARFADMDVDQAAGTLVTSAELPRPVVEASIASEADKKQDEQRLWEFCKWDLASGRMLDRWTEPFGTEQQISLAEGGQLIVYASDNNTIVAEAKKDGKRVFETDARGTFFAVPNPTASNILMMVKRSGSVRVLDSKNLNSFDAASNRLDFDLPENSSLLTTGDVPLVGEWSPLGDRFYLVWASGRVTEFGWENRQLALIPERDLRPTQGLRLLDLGIRQDEQVEPDSPATGVQLRSRDQIEMKVRNVGDEAIVYFAIRFPGNEGRTRLTRITFPRASSKSPRIAIVEEELGRQRLTLSDSSTPALQASLNNALGINDRDIVTAKTFGDATFVATTTGTVYRIQEDGISDAFGNPPTIAGTGDALAKRVVLLQEGGVLQRAEWSEEGWNWTRLESTGPDAVDVQMSPSGEQVIVTFAAQDGQRLISIVDAETGKSIQQMPEIACAAWAPDGSLAMVRQNGSIETSPSLGEKTRVVGEMPDADIASVRSLHFFRETWASDDADKQWLVVFARQQDTSAALHYFDLDGEDIEPRMLALPQRTIEVACSPTDNVIVTGGSGGNVAVRFASPSLSELGQELFSINGHAGASMNSITFSGDGKTVVTSDNAGKLYAWLSTDVLGGLTTTVGSSEASQVQ